MTQLAILLLVLGSGNLAMAHMVIYKNGIGISQSGTADFGATDVNYTFSRKFAAVYRHFRIDESQFPAFQELNIGQINYLLKRWNRPDSQGNVYLGLGYGERETTSYQVEADWEDRRYYFATEYGALNSRKIDGAVEMHKVRLGLAPYVAETDSLHSWLILQYMKNTLMRNEESLTPLVRLFYKSALVEFGYSFQGEFNFTFMIHI